MSFLTDFKKEFLSSLLAPGARTIRQPRICSRQSPHCLLTLGFLLMFVLFGHYSVMTRGLTNTFYLILPLTSPYNPFFGFLVDLNSSSDSRASPPSPLLLFFLSLLKKKNAKLPENQHVTFLVEASFKLRLKSQRLPTFLPTFLPPVGTIIA